MAWQWLLSRARLCEYCDRKHYPVCHSQVSSQSPNWSLHNNFSLVIWACRLPIKVHLRGRYSKSVSDVDDSDHTLGESDNCTLWFKATAPNVKVLWCKIVILLMRAARGKSSGEMVAQERSAVLNPDMTCEYDAHDKYQWPLVAENGNRAGMKLPPQALEWKMTH